MDLQQMTDSASIAKGIAYSSLAASSGTGLWTWLDVNSGAVGAACSIAFGVVGVGFMFANYRLNQLRTKRDYRE